MIDDPTGIALRDHLDDLLAGVRPHPSLLDNIRTEHHRRSRRRAIAMASGSVLTSAVATAVVVWGSTAGVVHHGHGGGGRTPQPVPLASPTYPPAQPDETWFSAFGLPRPSGQIARFTLPPDDNDPPDSQHTLLVWYNAGKDTFCAMDIVQTAQYPQGSRLAGGGGGGCSDSSPGHTTHTGLVTSSESCNRDYWPYLFGLVGANAPVVKVHGVGGPDPELIVKRLDGAPRSFFIVIDATAPALRFDYFASDGHLVRQDIERHGGLGPNAPVDCHQPVPTASPPG